MVTSQRFPHGVLVGFAPWIAHDVAARVGPWPAGVVVALLVAAAACARRLRRGTARTMEVGAFVVFAGLAVAGLVLGSDAVAPRATTLAGAALAVLAWGSLAAGRPFIAEYTRDVWPRHYWDAPLFRRVNALVTAVWAGVFTINIGLAALAPALLAVILSQATAAMAIAGSIVLPRVYPRRWAAREIASRDPYPWPTPGLAPRPATGRGRRHHVVVVGSGIGGLTAAALLADRGLDVLVLEQHYLPGGFCTAWPRIVRRGEQRLRYVFDAGVHDVSGLGPRGPVRALLARLDLEDRLAWRRVGHEYILPGFRLRVPERVEDYIAALAERFPAEREGLSAFFAEMEAIYRELYADAHTTGGVPRPPATVEGMLAYPDAHSHAFRWMHVPFGRMLDAYVRDPQLRAVLSVLTGYLTETPEALSAMAMAPIFGYYFDGGRYPVGSSQALADALVAAIEARGGTVALRTPVRRIVVERGRATGVELADGRRVHADAVVSNADVRRTFLELIGREHLARDFARRVEALRPSTSAFAVFLGADFVPDISHLTLMSADGQGLGIAVPSLSDPSLAPPGHSAITLVSLMPPDLATWDRAAPDYRARKRAAGDALIALAERAIPGLSDRVVYRQDGSPATFARYAWTSGGSIYGPALGPWRAPARSPIEGLVLAGAGVFPGAGVEAVVISGTLAADALCPAAARRAPGSIAA